MITFRSFTRIILLIMAGFILIWGLIEPLGIRAALQNNAWSVAVVRDSVGNSTPLIEITNPPTTHPRAELFIAHTALINDDLDLALTTLIPLLNSKNQLALGTFADICFLQGDYSKAILLWKALDEWVLLEQVPRVLSQDENLDTNILAYQKAFEINPERYTPHILRSMRTKANGFIVNEQYDQAIEVYLELLTYLPEEASAYIDLAWTYLLNDLPVRADETITQGMDFYPEEANYYTETAEIYLQMDQPEKAMEAYRRALAIDPGSATALQGIEFLSGTDD